jgi:hypothetical protein
MLKERLDPGKKPTMKIKCKCGRKIIIKRVGFDRENFECATCETLGLDESRRSFLELNKSCDQTIFN